MRTVHHDITTGPPVTAMACGRLHSNCADVRRRFLPKAAEQQYLLSEFLKVLKACAHVCVLHGRSVSWISSLSSPQILYTFQDLTILLLMILSRVSEITIRSQKIDYDCIATRHNRTDQELHT
ncbi:hypothetical protein TNCV_1760181 [Trichonephila clavipes]|nr:hypothetical protein TNCV_1760181 [Trichonephila clavipes]